jgi:hypothetical protein
MRVDIEQQKKIRSGVTDFKLWEVRQGCKIYLTFGLKIKTVDKKKINACSGNLYLNVWRGSQHIQHGFSDVLCLKVCIIMVNRFGSGCKS